MKFIAVEVVTVTYTDGEGEHEMQVNHPAEPLPVDSVRNVFDAVNMWYVCYGAGDELPL